MYHKIEHIVEVVLVILNCSSNRMLTVRQHFISFCFASFPLLLLLLNFISIIAFFILHHFIVKHHHP